MTSNTKDSQTPEHQKSNSAQTSTPKSQENGVGQTVGGDLETLTRWIADRALEFAEGKPVATFPTGKVREAIATYTAKAVEAERKAAIGLSDGALDRALYLAEKQGYDKAGE